MTALARRREFNDADLRYAYQALLALRDARGESDVAATWATDPRLRAVAVRAREMQDDDIRAITMLLSGWGQVGAIDLQDSQALRRGPGVATGELRSLDKRELDRRLAAMLTSDAEAAIVSARTEMVEGFEGTSRRIAQHAIRANSRDLSALGRLTLRPPFAEARPSKSGPGPSTASSGRPPAPS